MTMRKSLSLFAALSLLGTLAACSSGSAYQAPPPPAPNQSWTAQPAPVPGAPQPAPAPTYGAPAPAPGHSCGAACGGPGGCGGK